MSPFAIPTNLTIDYYKKLLSQVVMHDEKARNKYHLRRLNKAEQEIMLWALVKEKKYSQTFSREKIIDGPVQNLEWKLLKEE